MSEPISDRSRLIKIAAEMLGARGFISPCVEDNPKTTPKSILRQAEKQEAQLKEWAHKIAEIARSIE